MNEKNEIATKVCRICGRELPIDAFYKSNKTDDGRSHICRECKKMAHGGHIRTRYNKFTTDELVSEIKARGVNLIPEPSPREMMERLAALGYKGKLTYTRVETIDIENF